MAGSTSASTAVTPRRVELLLFETPDAPEPFQVIALAPETNRTFHFWHVWVEGLPAGTCYAWRMDGPQDTEQTGRRFNARKDLLDPWARAVSDLSWDRRRGADPDDAGHASLRAFVTDVPPKLPRVEPRGLDGAVIYELHVGGFTRHPASGVAHPGTFAGLIEKIPYLRELGVTHVELMPVMAFDAQDLPPAAAERGLSNYWGYSTHSFWSPHPRYCREPARAAHEFRALTDALHAAGIGVLLDVVFNHTAESGASGPTINFKGLANDVVYIARSGGQAPLPRLHRLRQHRQLQSPAGDRLHRPLPRVLGRAPRRGRVPLRSRERLCPRRAWRGDGRPAAALGDRVLADPRSGADDRRGLGRGGPLSGRRLPRNGLGRMERPIS